LSVPHDGAVLCVRCGAAQSTSTSASALVVAAVDVVAAPDVRASFPASLPVSRSVSPGSGVRPPAGSTSERATARTVNPVAHQKATWKPAAGGAAVAIPVWRTTASTAVPNDQP